MLPLDGSPSRSTALIAHPGKISCISVVNGNMVATTSEKNGVLSIWKVDEAALVDRALQEEAEAAASGISKYASMVEGSADGGIYEELLDYFYYAQIRAQGESTLERRKITQIDFRRWLEYGDSTQ